MVSDSVATRPCYLVAPRKDHAISQPALKRVFSAIFICYTVTLRCLISPRIAESQPSNDVLTSQALPKNRFTNTALRKPCFTTGCEIAWCFRGAARYQGLVATLSDTMVFSGTSEACLVCIFYDIPEFTSNLTALHVGYVPTEIKFCKYQQ